MFNYALFRRVVSEPFRPLYFRLKVESAGVILRLSPKNVNAFKIFWGDGLVENYIGEHIISHTYSQKSMHEIRIYADYLDIWRIDME